MRPLDARCYASCSPSTKEGQVGLGGPPLGKVPWFAPWKGSKPSSRSKVGQLVHIAGLEARRGRRVSLSGLRGKLFRIEIADAGHDSQGKQLSPARTYSVVSEILERL